MNLEMKQMVGRRPPKQKRFKKMVRQFLTYDFLFGVIGMPYYKEGVHQGYRCGDQQTLYKPNTPTSYARDCVKNMPEVLLPGVVLQRCLRAEEAIFYFGSDGTQRCAGASKAPEPPSLPGHNITSGFLEGPI
jgi:hypothetical protein